MAEEEIGPEAVKPPDEPRWHLARADRPQILCGLTILYGSRRLLRAKAPEEERCEVCKRRLKLQPASQ